MAPSSRWLLLPLACVLLFTACRPAPEEPGTTALPDAYGDPPAALEGLVFHAPYELVCRALMQRFETRGESDAEDELRFNATFWGFPGTAKLHFLSNSLRMLESVRVTLHEPLRKVIPAVEPELEICAPYARKKLKHGVAFLWSDSNRVLFTVKITALDLSTTEVAYIDTRPYWTNNQTPNDEFFRSTLTREDEERLEDRTPTDRWEGNPVDEDWRPRDDH